MSGDMVFDWLRRMGVPVGMPNDPLNNTVGVGLLFGHRALDLNGPRPSLPANASRGQPANAPAQPVPPMPKPSAPLRKAGPDRSAAFIDWSKVGAPQADRVDAPRWLPVAKPLPIGTNRIPDFKARNSEYDGYLDALFGPKPTSDPFQPRKKLVVVIGGGGDGYFGPDSSPAQDYRTHIPNSLYFTHLDATWRNGHVVDTIQNAAGGRPVILIGHSWGGPNAYDMVSRLERAGVRTSLLVTADPVSSVPSFSPRPDTRWVNLTAAPTTLDESDFVAAAGGKPSQLPIGKADLNGVVQTNHVNLHAMMRAPLNGGPSAEHIVRQSQDSP